MRAIQYRIIRDYSNKKNEHKNQIHAKKLGLFTI